MSESTDLLETVNGAAVNIAPTDEKLNLQDIYTQLDTPSLGQEIFKVYNQNGPMAGIFALGTVGDKFKLLRKNSEVYDSEPINTGISKEAIQDIEAQFGLDSKKVIAHLLRSLANAQENTKTSAFLNANATPKGDLTLTNKANARVIVEEIAQKASEEVIDINSGGFISYQAVVVVPMKYAASFMARSLEDINTGVSFYVGKTGLVKYYTDPDITNTDTVFVVLRDEDRSSAFFSKYTDDIITAVDYDTGAENLFIFNRFAITANPRHDIKPMIHSFKLL